MTGFDLFLWVVGAAVVSVTALVVFAVLFLVFTALVYDAGLVLLDRWLEANPWARAPGGHLVLSVLCRALWDTGLPEGGSSAARRLWWMTYRARVSWLLLGDVPRGDADAPEVVHEVYVKHLAPLEHVICQISV